ncbi:recombinase RecT [Micromonospora sp. WMMD1102]|uniref:recombinase RecT n=1 Tax=Micromonospora sp. WMMD1102 TaxID=3016105 RepID=UPI002415691B|nr:recombinase RecT [Micromonospora sp. WMMD1102]MDG4784388.1 recombinase RecT [Micromonospora sp. WMMD1102]
MAETIANAVAQRDNSPAGLIKQYSTSFAQVLPSHVKAETWVRLAQGALKRGRRVDDKPTNPFELEQAAANNPGVFLAALLDAARLGLDPGTEQYYLTPRKQRGRLEILGIVGYQGHIELMYRAGAVSSIVAEVVRENDEYRYQRGVDEVPVHRFRPFASEADRGPLLGVYAYARMKDGAVSRVVELGRDDIARIKQSSQGSDSKYSPWVNHEAAMWLKSAVRQLQKWVPTSAEYRREQLRAAAEAQRVAAEPLMPEGTAAAQADYIDGDVVEDAADVPAEAPPVEPDAEDWPTTATPGGQP